MSGYCTFLFGLSETKLVYKSTKNQDTVHGHIFDEKNIMTNKKIKGYQNYYSNTKGRTNEEKNFIYNGKYVSNVFDTCDYHSIC